MDRDRDFAEAFEAAFSSLRRAVDEVCAAETEWTAKAAAAVSTALEFAAEAPGAARVLAVDPFANGLFGALRYRRMVTHFATLLKQGRAEGRGDGSGLPALTEEALGQHRQHRRRAPAFGPGGDAARSHRRADRVRPDPLRGGKEREANRRRARDFLSARHIRFWRSASS